MVEKLQEVVEILDKEQDAIIIFDAVKGEIASGGAGTRGHLVLRDATGNQRTRLEAGNLLLGGSGSTGVVEVTDKANSVRVQIAGGALDVDMTSKADVKGPLKADTRPSIPKYNVDKNGNIVIVGEVGGGKGGKVPPQDLSRTLIGVDNVPLRVRNKAGKITARLGLEGDLTLGGPQHAGRVAMRDGEQRPRIEIDAEESSLLIRDGSGVARVELGVGGLTIRTPNGKVAATLASSRLELLDGNGVKTAILDGASGDLLLKNADVAEFFDAGEPGAGPGTLVVLDDEARVRPSASPYDRRVAGVVSGAGPVKPAILLNSDGSKQGRVAVALAGRAYCLVDAAYGSVAVGDLLTTSASRGHAMRASEPGRSVGAIVGKSLGKLSHGRGLVPVLLMLR